MPAAISTALNRELEVAGADLVRRFGGTWYGTYGMCRCPVHDDRTPSLSVRVGDTRLLLKCFAGCDTRDVLSAIRRIDGSILSAKGDGAPPAWVDEWIEGRVHELWQSGQNLSGSLAGAYRRNRLIDSYSTALRYHDRTPLGRRAQLRLRPAMLAAITSGSGLLALERTFLEPPGRRARGIGKPRRMLGRPRNGSVRLAPASDVLGLAEGVETAMSAMILLGFPVWATLGSERLAHVAIPGSVRTLILLPDNDRAGRIGAEAALIAHAADGRTVRIDWPWGGLNDWNDVLRGQRGERGKGLWRQVA